MSDFFLRDPLVLALAPAALVFAAGWGILPGLDRRNGLHRVLLILAVLAVSARYYAWRIDSLSMAGKDGAGGWFALPLFGLELLALLEALISMLMLSKVADRKAEIDAGEARLKEKPLHPMVDVFIPTYNEELEVLEKTILGALALDWPKDRFKVWVLDDKRRQWLKDYCAEKGAGYLTRADNAHAKAGNINAALKVTEGEFVAVFDADFVPRKGFLKRTIGLFDDPKIGCVQTPHHFYNSDPVQANLLMNGIMPDDQRLFFDVVMPSRDAWDAAFCCGSCGVLRRTAVEAIGGGIPTSSVTEDILSTLAMKREGYVTRYVNEKLAFGLAAESVKAFFVQRERWARGGIQLMFLKDGPFGPGHRLIDRILFFPVSWLIQYAMRLVGLLLPAACLWTGLSPMPGVGLEDVVSHQIPFLIAFYWMMRWMAPGHHIPLLTSASQCFASFRLAPSIVCSLAKPFGTPFKVTPKGGAAGGSNLDKRTFGMAAAAMAATIAGLAMNIGFDAGHGVNALVAGWCVWNIAQLAVVMMICFETPRRRAEERFPADEPMTVAHARGSIAAARAKDFSLTGGRALLVHGEAPLPGDEIRVSIGGVGHVPANLIAVDGKQIRFAFDWRDPQARDRMIVKLFASGMHEAGLRRASVPQLLKAAFSRLFGRTWLEAKPEAKPQPQASDPLPAMRPIVDQGLVHARSSIEDRLR